MTDRELIELAAKAAGIDVLFHRDCPRDVTGMPAGMNVYAAPPWNPLTSDADAFRLAVNLELEISFPEENPPVVLVWGCNWAEEMLGDPYVATRRAITQAAAEIGKGM